MNAADSRLSAWVAANAGAGKTYTLAARVTRLLLAGARPERILCLTYTKAAAAEMAGRLFDQLGQWSMLPDGDLAAKISEIGAEPGGVEGLKEARRLFAKALETLGGLKIQTIHSFCQYVLTRFPLEAGVPASFQVLDERSARELMAEARRRVLERSSHNKTLAAAVVFLVEHLSDMKLGEILDGALGADRGKLDRALETLGGPDNDWSALLRTAHGAAPGDTPEKIAEEFSASLKAGEKKLREVIAWLAGGSKTDQGRAADFAAALETKNESDCFEGFRAALLTQEGSPRATLATKKLAEARPELLAFLSALCERMYACENRRRAAHAAALAEAALTVIQAVREVYDLEKKARNSLDYDDLIAGTHRLLQTSGSAWVLYKLDEGIDHILIDEAQDTSALQWDIVQRLTEEFFAGQGAERPLRTLFAVGDEKQSIFSFQGADPAQFELRRAYFARRAKEGRRDFSEENLIASWRSAPEVLQFVDEVFADPAARDGLTSAGIKHLALKTNLKGCVEFWPALVPPDEPERDPWNLMPLDLERESSPVVRLAIEIAERIAGWLQSHAALPGHAEPIKPGDIMILLPRREPFGSEIIRRLKERGVKVAGADRLALTEQIAVMDLMALGRFALLPEDDLNLAALLRSPLLGLSEEDLFSLAFKRAGSLWQSLAARQKDFPAAHALLAEARARADYAPPFEFYAWALTEGRRKLLKRLGNEASDPIDEFLSLALQYERAQTPSLEGFLHWLERGGAVVKRDMERGRDEVRVMTVHGSKGLEADIVILPDTTRTPGEQSARGHLLYTDDGVLFPVPEKTAPEPVRAARAAAKEEALKEYRRLLYVALTRAKERLVICGFENKRGNQPGSWHMLAERAAKTLGTENDKGAYVFGESALDSLKPKATAPAKPFALPAWALAPAKPERPAPWLIRPSVAAGMDEPAPPSPLAGAARFKRGLWVHAMLAHLPDADPAQRAAIAQRFLSSHGLDREECEVLTRQTLAVLDDPAFAPAFAPGSRAEVSLVADLPELGPEARVHGRVDRLAVSADNVLIVDFKTGKPVAAETDLPALYATQMALYRAAASRIFPGKRIACALVWTEGPVLMPLSAAFLDAETQHIRSRLDRARTGS